MTTKVSIKEWEEELARCNKNMENAKKAKDSEGYAWQHDKAHRIKKHIDNLYAGGKQA